MRLGVNCDTQLKEKFHQIGLEDIKSQVRTQITDVHLENCLRVATSVEVNIDALNSAKQSQTSH